MEDLVIIGLVVTIAVAAHVWLFMWVKFKIDESVILKVLQQNSKSGVLFSKEISAQTDIGLERVTAVCKKSEGVHVSAHSEDAWRVLTE